MNMPLLRASRTRGEDTRPAAICDVLIVEDDPTQAEEITCYLSRAGLAIQILQSGSEALHCVAEMRPRVALLDYNLPDLDGVTVAERIRRLSPETAMLMMSGRIDGLPEPTLRKVGLYSFVNKPVQPGQLLSSVRRMVRAAARTCRPALWSKSPSPCTTLWSSSPAAASASDPHAATSSRPAGNRRGARRSC